MIKFFVEVKESIWRTQGAEGGGGVLAQGVKQTRTATGIRMRFCYDKDKD